jgi:uncharacterized protein (DUF2147 family)
MHLLSKILIVLIFNLPLCVTVWSGELSGLWQEYNDDTGNPEALIRIEKTPDNRYEGRIEKIFLPVPENTALLCTQCKGKLHNRPLLGLHILSGLQRKDKQSFEEGEILDPDDGNIYRCNIRLSDDGNTIEVTGYLSFNWIGHSEIWRKVK